MQAAAIDVLVVEDDHAQSETLAHAIRQAGLSTDIAGGVLETKRLLARGSYTVLVLGLLLPDGSGIEILDFIRAERLARMQIIVIADADTSPLMERIDPDLVQRVRFRPVIAEVVVSVVLGLIGPN